MRALVADVHVRVDDLVAPLFVREGIDAPQPIASLPGVVQHTIDSLRSEVADLVRLDLEKAPDSPAREAVYDSLADHYPCASE